MADPYRVGYGDLPFRSKSLHGNPGVARLQLGNAPLERGTDILIRQDVELRPKAFCGTLPHRKPAAGTAVKRVMRIVALLGLPVPAHLQPDANAAHPIIDPSIAQILQHIAADPGCEVVGPFAPRRLARGIATGSPRWASGSPRGSRWPAASRAAAQETASRAPDPPDARRYRPNPRLAR